MPSIQNKTFDEIKPGDKASAQRTLQARDVRAWFTAFGDAGMLIEAGDTQDTAGIVTAILTSLAGSALPGPGSSIRSTTVQVLAALPINAIVKAQLTVREKRVAEKLLILEGQCTDPAGRLVATAVLEVLAPTARIRRELPEHRLEGLLERCRGLKPMLTGVVHPCSAEALAGAIEAAQAGLIVPVLFGPEQELRQVAKAAKLDLSAYRIVTSEGPEDWRRRQRWRRVLVRSRR